MSLFSEFCFENCLEMFYHFTIVFYLLRDIQAFEHYLRFFN